jgi:P27 family predicted phage terminase small subunit
MPDPKPASENLIVTGTRAQAAPSEPAPILECPPELGRVAREEWDRVLRDLPKSVDIKNCDRALFAAYCNAYARWTDAVAGLEEFGPMLRSPKGFPLPSPYLAMANEQANIMLRIANALGLSPASRNRFPWRSAGDLDLQI